MGRNGQQKKLASAALAKIQVGSMLNGERRTTIFNMKMAGEQVKGLDLNCADFVGCEISGSSFYNCDLRGVSFKESSLKGVEFVNCQVLDMELPKKAKSVTFSGCSLEPAGTAGLGNSGLQTQGEEPATLYGKTMHMIDAVGRVTRSLSTEKLLCLGIILAFITIIVVAAHGK